MSRSAAGRPPATTRRPNTLSLGAPEKKSFAVMLEIRMALSILIGTIPVPINKDKCPGCLREKRRLVREAQRFLRKRWFANHPNLAARPRSLADGGDEDYTDRGPKRASIIRLACATISSERLFSRLEGLSAIARVEPGAKIAALQPFPTGLTSMRCPLYSIAVIAYLAHCILA